MLRATNVLWSGSLCALLAAACGPAQPKFAITHVEKRARLDNGLRMVIMPDSTTPLVQVDVRYEVGSKEDPPGKAGLAHLVDARRHLPGLREDGPLLQREDPRVDVPARRARARLVQRQRGIVGVEEFADRRIHARRRGRWPGPSRAAA